MFAVWKYVATNASITLIIDKVMTEWIYFLACSDFIYFMGKQRQHFSYNDNVTIVNIVLSEVPLDSPLIRLYLRTLMTIRMDTEKTKRRIAEKSLRTSVELGEKVCVVMIVWSSGCENGSASGVTLKRNCLSGGAFEIGVIE